MELSSTKSTRGSAFRDKSFQLAIQIAPKATDSKGGQTSGASRLLIINYHTHARARELRAETSLYNQTVPPNCLDGRARKRKTTGAAFSALINCTAASGFSRSHNRSRKFQLAWRAFHARESGCRLKARLRRGREFKRRVHTDVKFPPGNSGVSTRESRRLNKNNFTLSVRGKWLMRSRCCNLRRLLLAPLQLPQISIKVTAATAASQTSVLELPRDCARELFVRVNLITPSG